MADLAKFLRIELLPALHGDCLWIEYGDTERTRRMLIDGGPIGAWPALEGRIASLPEDNRLFELMAITHVDTDHIEGMVRLLAIPRTGWRFAVRQVWFNGWRQMNSSHGLLGGMQGEYLGALLARRLDQGAWNASFQGGPVVVPDTGPLPEASLADGMKLTLLSPTPGTLAKMSKAWEKDVQQGGITPGNLEAAWVKLAGQKKYLPGTGLLGSSPQLDALLEKQSKPDASAANGSSIAFLVEFAGKSCLFLADAHADVIAASLRRLLEARQCQRLQVDAVKVAHHGSKYNLSEELLALLDCPNYLISTNGDIFQHPDEEALALIVARSFHQPPTLHFNYRSAHTAPWLDPERQARDGYRARVREASEASLALVL